MPMQSNVLIAETVDVDLRVQMIRVVSLNRFQIQKLDSYSILRFATITKWVLFFIVERAIKKELAA
jgi:hypothetical protein